MFARVSTFQGPPDQTAEGIRLAREQILPAARLMDGFKGIYLLYDRESGKSLSVTLWETEADMQASEEAASQVRTQSAVSCTNDRAGLVSRHCLSPSRE